MQTALLLLILSVTCNGQIYAPVYIPNWSFDNLIPSDYDMSQPPIITKESGQLEPVVILITVNVTQLTRVDASEQTFTVDIIFSQRWRDHRLTLPPADAGVKTVPLATAIRKKLWIPDVFVGNSVKPIMLIMTPLFMEIDMDTRSLVATSRQVVELRCPMDLYHFPLDEQVCPIEFTLLRNPRDRVILRFEETHSSRIDFSNYYIIQDVRRNMEECVSIRGSSYSCVAAKLELFRKFSYYLIRIYSPSFLLVVTSFVGFWVPPMGHSARTALIVTPLLALITQQTMISQEINVSYLVAIHIWMIINTSFVFLSLVEYACAIIHSHYVDDAKDAEQTITFHKQANPFFASCNAFLRLAYGSSVPFHKNPMDRNKVDYAARILFPLVYFSFVSIYFAVFLGPWVMHKMRHEAAANFTNYANMNETISFNASSP